MPAAYYLASSLSTAKESHHFYPVLFYFRSREPSTDDVDPVARSYHGAIAPPIRT